MKRATRKRGATKAKPKQAESDRRWVSASIRYTDTSRGFTSSRSSDFELVARAVQNTAFSAANMNATAAAGFAIKLYRPASGRSVHKEARVKDSSRLAWLRGERGVRPSAKAVQAATVADEVVEVTDHPVLDTLENPAPHMTGAQWRWLMFFYGEVAGRGYVYTGERSPFGPTSLYPLAPQYTSINADKLDYIKSYTYGVEGGANAVVLPADQVIYHRERPHPFSPLHAMSWMHSVQAITDLEAAAIQSELARWNNGGIPGMAITYKDQSGKTTAAQVRQAEEEFNQRHRGADKAGSTLFLLNGEIAQYGPKPHEMQYVEGQRRVEEAIYRAAGIPEPVWRMGSSNRASAVASDPQWMGATILPKLNALADTLTAMLLPLYPGTEGWWFAYENPVREDVEAVSGRAIAWANAGLITGNEARSLASIEKGGEELDVLRVNGVPIDSVGQVPEYGGDFVVTRNTPKAEEPAEEPEPDEAEESEEAEEKPEEATGEKSAKFTKEVPSSRDSDQIVASFQRMLTKWYNDAVRSAVKPDGSVDLREAERALKPIVDTHLGMLFEAGAREGARQLGLSGVFDMERPDAVAYLNREGGRLITSVTESLAGAIGTRIAALTEQGASLAEVQSGVAQMGVADWSAERIARTEWSFAYNEGARMVWSSEGVEEKDFILAGGPCPICSAAHDEYGGKGHPIDEPYYRAGDSITADGRVYTFQNDMQGPPWHPNCRCALIPRKARRT